MFPAHVDGAVRALALKANGAYRIEIPVSKASLYHGDNVVIGRPARSNSRGSCVDY